jgi:YbbR domain-containing protein
MRWSEIKDIRTWGDLRRYLGRDFGIRLLALMLAVGLWMFVNAGQRATLVELAVPINYRSLPPGLVITNDVPDFVRIEVTGPRTLLSLLDPERLTLRLDLNGIGQGSTEYKLLPSMFNVPRQTTVTRISPSQLSLEVDRVVRRELPVSLDLEGAPAKGYSIASIDVNPSKVSVIGPSRVVDKLDRATTEPVSVAGLSADLERPVRIVSPNPLVTLSAAEVAARVDVAEIIEDREFKRVAVAVHDSGYKFLLRDKQASVTVRGPVVRLDGLDPEHLAYVDAKGVQPGWHELPLKIDLPDGVELVRQSPEKVRLRVYREKLPGAADGKPS